MSNYTLKYSGGAVDTLLGKVEEFANMETFSSDGITAYLFAGVVYVYFSNDINFSESWGVTSITTLPSNMCPSKVMQVPLMLQGDYNATPATLKIETTGEVQGVHKGGNYASTTWGFAFVAYPAAQSTN